MDHSTVKKTSAGRPGLSAGSRQSLVSAAEFFIPFYLVLSILWQGLYRIVPIMNIVLKARLLWIDPFLCWTGTILALIMLLFSRRHCLAPGFVLLCGICIVAAVSSFFQRRYGIKENTISILWMFVCFALFYSSTFFMNRRSLKRCVCLGYIAFLIPWSVASFLSLVQFALQIGYNAPNHAMTKWLGGPGFNAHQHRLYGLFTYPEYGAVPGLMLLLAGACYFIQVRRLHIRAALVLLNTPVFLYIVLCTSRNAELALYEVTFVGAFLLSQRHSGKNGMIKNGMNKKRKISPLLTALLITAAVFVICQTLRQAAEYIPGFFETDETVSESRSDVSVPSISVPHRLLPCSILDAISSEQTGLSRITAVSEEHRRSAGSGALSPASAVPAAAAKNDRSDSPLLMSEEEDQDGTDGPLLRREYKEGDLSNGRRRIWKDYLSLYKEIGLFGLSPENSGPFIKELDPNLYIVRFVRVNDPVMYETGYVFHTHNGYLKVFVSTGFLGFSLLLIFVLLSARKIILHILLSDSLTDEFIFSLLICITGASCAFFDAELFFNTNPTTLMFWLSLGILMRSSGSPAGKRIPG